jgi:DNA-binding CsgD family transcriptional regulator
MSESARRANIVDLLPKVKVPTLILQNRRLADDEPISGFAEFGQAAAALIPGARVIHFDGWASIWFPQRGEPPAAVQMIDAFVRDVAPAEEPRSFPVPAPAGLSPRETEILRRIALGRSNQQIAYELVLSVRTVERHITNLYAKIGARGKADATAYALRSGLA